MATKFKRKGHWYIKYKDVDGKWKNKSCGITAKQNEAEYLRKQYDAKELNNYHKAPVRLLNVEILDALKKFKEEILPGEEKADSSIKREKAAVDNIISFVESKGITSFKEVSNSTMVEYMNERKRRGRAIKTRREERRLLRKFYKWTIKNNYCTVNPAEDLPLPKLIKKKPRYFSKDELSRIFAAAKEPYRTIFKFLYLTGLRIGELSNLKWPDFMENERHIIIRILDGNKNKREEIVHLNKDAYEIIMKRKAASDSPVHIFLNAEGNKLDNDNIYRNLKSILDKLTIKDASPHTFRHTCASHLVIRGVSIYTVKEILRHKSVKETEIYAHLSKQAVRNAVEILSLES